MLAETKVRPQYGLASIARDVKKTHEKLERDHPSIVTRKEIAREYLPFKGAKLPENVPGFVERALKGRLVAQRSVEQATAELSSIVQLEQNIPSVVEDSIPQARRGLLPRILPFVHR